MWIAKWDLYPKIRRQARHELHLEFDVSHKRAAELEIRNQASQKPHLKHGFSHLDREEHAADFVCNLSQSHLEKDERRKGNFKSW